MIGMRHRQIRDAQYLSNQDSLDGENVLILSSSLLTDRMLLYTDFLPILSREARVKVWTCSCWNPRFREIWQAAPAIVEALPELRPFKQFPFNYLRRLNEFVWDFRLRPPTRLSIMRRVRKNTQKRHIRALRIPARLLALMRVEQLLEERLERLLLSYSRSYEARQLMDADCPTVVLTTGPHRFEEPAVVAEAKKLGIPVLAFITSWDNLSSKNRMVFQYDGFLVWSEQMAQELHHFYPYTRDVPVYMVGAPQFDLFFGEQFSLTREEFCARQGLDPEKPIIVYALGSPNLIPGEWYGALHMAEKTVEGELGKVQMLVRPHPLFDDGQLIERFQQFRPEVITQMTGQAGLSVASRFQDREQICEWVNTFRHADVVINFSSTVAIDAAIFDKPVVNLDFDPEPGQPHQALIKDVNHAWTHFKPIAESGGVWLVNNFDEIVEAVKTYLRHPEMHREKRHWIAEYVCGYLDGRCGERMAEAILEFVHHHRGNCNRRKEK